MSIQTFNPKLVKAFEKMVLGINIEITEECRKFWGSENLGRWFFITAIECDESISIQSSTHQTISNLKLSDLKL